LTYFFTSAFCVSPNSSKTLTTSPFSDRTSAIILQNLPQVRQNSEKNSENKRILGVAQTGARRGETENMPV